MWHHWPLASLLGSAPHTMVLGGGAGEVDKTPTPQNFSQLNRRDALRPPNPKSQTASYPRTKT